MLEKILNFLRGSVRIYAEKRYSDRLVAFLTERKLVCKITPDMENGGVYVDISPILLKNIASSLDKSGIIVYIIYVYGFSRLSSRYRHRPGIILGCLLFALILWTSTLFVWRVETDGSVLISKEQLRYELAEMGVSPGCRISEIDKSTVANRFLSLHPELSWAALNFNGTTVSLTVKETLSPPVDEEKNAPLLVAKHSGVVTFVGVYEGCAAVKPGTVVKKGDVLISGYVSGSGLQITDTPLLRPGNARGSVKAEVSGKIKTQVLLEEKYETLMQGEKIGHRISVFGHEISFGKTEKSPSERKNVTVFGFIELPIIVETFTETLTTENTVSRTYDKAAIEAESRVYKELYTLYPDCEITKIKFTLEETDNGVFAEAEYICITEITEKKYLSESR